jgi:hypothetical protein
MIDRLEAELAEAIAELRAHKASWAYAYAMAGGANGGREHPVHWETRHRTELLEARCRELQARLDEHQL